MKKYRVSSILWDTDKESVNLPNEIIVTAECVNDIADLLSDKFGWCIVAFKAKEIKQRR